MKKKAAKKKQGARSLRQRAEDILGAPGSDLSDETKRLLHDLHLHQVELEIQNEELRQAQVELAEARDRYADLYEFAPVAYVTLDKDGKILEANLTAATLLGTSLSQLAGARLAQFVSPDSQDTWHLHRQAVLASQTRQTCVLEMRAPGETELFVQVESIRVETGDDPQCRATLADISGRKNAEKILIQLNLDLDQSLRHKDATLQENMARLKLLSEAAANLGEGVLITGNGLEWPGPEIIYVNDAMCRITGYSAEELIGETPRILQGEATGRIVLDRIRTELAAGRPCEVELINYRRDGSPYHASISLAPMAGGDGAPSGFVSVHRDISRLKQIEAALRQSEERFRNVYEHAATGIVIADGQGRLQLCNPAFCSLVGCTEEELRGREFASLVDPEDRAANQAVIRSLKNGEITSFQIEDRYLCKDEKRVWVHQFFSVLPGSPGQPDLLLAVVKNITPRIRAEKALRASESRLKIESRARARLNEAGTRLWQLDNLEEGLEEMLGAAIELLGADQGNFQLLDPGRGVLTIAAQRGFKEEFLDGFREVSIEQESACGRALRSGERVAIEDVEQDESFAPYREMARSAGYRAVQSTPLTGRDGRPLGIISTHFRNPHAPDEQDLRWLDLYARQAADFIERCRMEASLRDGQLRLRAILDAAADSIIIFDPKGYITGINPATGRLFGRQEKELTGANIATLLPELREEDLEPAAGAVLETRARRKDGTVFPVSLAVSRVEDLDLRIAILRDITKRKRYEEDLEQLVRERTAELLKAERLAALGQVAANVAHELRTPLGTIRNDLHYLESTLQTSTDPEMPSLLDEMKRAVASSDLIILEMLDFVREHKPVFEVFPLGPVIRQARAAAAIPANIRVRLPEGDGPDVHANRDQITRILQNLIRNAVHSMPGGGELTIGVKQTDGRVEITVRDTGHGIAREHLGKLFEPLFTTKPTGIGLGLAISRRYAELNSGRIEVESEPGKGATFRVILHRGDWARESGESAPPE